MEVRSVTVPLWVKLTGIIAAVIVVGVVVTVVLARQGTQSQFSHVMMGNQMVQPVVLQERLVAYYEGQRSWAGLDSRLAQIVAESSAGGMMGGMMGHMMGMFDGRIRVLNEEGVPVAAVGTAGFQDLLGIEQGWPMVVDGERVGTLLVDGTLMSTVGTDSDALLAGVTRAVVVAALVAGLVALLLGALLLRQITRPLAALNQASHRIAGGERDVQVPVRSSDEIGQLAHTFNRMSEALAHQERLRRNLMADVAHELRTPLSGVQGTVEAMQDGVFPATREHLSHIHEQVLLLNRLVEDLRTLAHADAGELQLQLESVDLASLAAAQVASQMPQAQAKEVDLRLMVDEEPSPINGDAGRLRQVLANLLSNALRHTPAGGNVTVRLFRQDDHVVLSVRDSGEGILPEHMPHVFDRFYRGDQARDRQTGGSGLGLAIARQLVETHGGRIQAESPPPGKTQGSQFTVWLPATRYGERTTSPIENDMSMSTEE